MAESVDPRMLRFAREKLSDWEAKSISMDAELPHVVVQHDPSTGTRQAVGPYRNAYAALIDTERMRKEIGEPIEFEVIPFFSAPGSGGT